MSSSQELTSSFLYLLVLFLFIYLFCSMCKKKRVLTNHELYFSAQKDISILYLSIFIGGGNHNLPMQRCPIRRDEDLDTNSP